MRSGKREIAGGGSIVTEPGDESVEFEYQNLRFRLVFQTVEGKNPEVAGRDDAGTIVFDLTNFDNSIGTHFSTVVAATGDKALHLAIYVFVLGEPSKKVRLINYTLSEEIGAS